MAQKKLQRFAAIKAFTNLVEYPVDMKGTWPAFFKNNHPITLELACGRGEYCIGLAKMFPGKNFIGVDVKGNRMYIGAKYGLENNIRNAGFLRTQIEMIPDYFAPNEVDEIWITFPDPQLRTSKARKRLTHPRFLRLYNQFLKPGGAIHLKTDSPALFGFTKKVISMFGLHEMDASEDVYADKQMEEVLHIKTHYETLDIANSKKIFYLKFSLPAALPALDDELQDFLKQTEPSLAS